VSSLEGVAIAATAAALLPDDGLILLLNGANRVPRSPNGTCGSIIIAKLI